jgi:hypothetical protein
MSDRAKYLRRDIDALAHSMEANGGDRYDAQRLAAMCAELKALNRNQSKVGSNGDK